MGPTTRLRISILSATGAALLALTACGTSGANATATSGVAGADTTAFAKKVSDDVAAASAAQSPDATPLPSKGPAPASGKSIVIIPCAMSVEGCARPARSAQEAARALGWQASIDDPAGDASKMSAAVKRAISSGANGIVLNSIDAAAIQGDLSAARAAGIAVVCDMCGNSGGIIQSVLPELQENERAGYLLGEQAYLEAKKRFNAAPKFIVMSDDEFATVRARVAGVKKFVKDCQAAGAGCEVVGEGQHLASEISTTAPARVVQLARSRPNYNVLFAGYDAALNFFAQGLQQAGLANPNKAFGISVDADVANTQMIRSKGFQAASAGVDMRRVGYGLVDNLNRLFAGQPVVDQGAKVKLINADNVPAKGSWDGDFDATRQYLALWGRG